MSEVRKREASRWPRPPRPARRNYHPVVIPIVTQHLFLTKALKVLFLRV